MEAPEPERQAPSLRGRVLKVALLMLLVALGLTVAVAWFADQPETLPFEYEGFD